mgnify:CR=1 FL=1
MWDRRIPGVVADDVVVAHRPNAGGRDLATLPAPTAPRPSFAESLAGADSAADAAQVVRDDPAVRHGVMRAELFPYRVALWAPAGPVVAGDGTA